MKELEDFFKCNAAGRGYKIKDKAVTTFEERTLLLKNTKNSNYEAVENNSTPRAGTSRSAIIDRRPSSDSGIELNLNVDTKAEDFYEITHESESECSVKRLKNEINSEKESNVEQVDTLVEEALFTDELLLRIIFANLSVSDLKSCRQVNRLWYVEATTSLHSRDCIAAIQILKDSVTFHYSCVFKPQISLEEFENILINAKLFPSTSFAVNDEPLSRSVVHFFRDHGHLVKSFCFEPEDACIRGKNSTKPGEILLLAAINFPNLTKLKFVDALDEHTSSVIEMAIENAPEMKNLHTLELDGDFPADVVSLILKRSCNLENIYLLTNPDKDFEFGLEKLVRLGNVIPRLKNISLIFTPDWFKMYQHILNQKPKFYTIGAIDVRDHREMDLERVGKFLTELFKECSESLREMLGLRCLGHIPGLTFPVFPNVKRLCIVPQSIPSNVDLAQVFPNLRKVELEFWRGVHPLQNTEVVPESLSPLESVRELQVSWGERPIPEIWIERFCTWFPNVISAKFCGPLSDLAYTFVWKLRRLQDLHLVIGSIPRVNLFPALDSAFTGFSLETVKNLFESEPEDLNLSTEDVVALRVNPSIVDLKELRKLTLRLFDATAKEDDYEDTLGHENVEVVFDSGSGKALLHVKDKIILSYITKRFGFDLCPQLESNVTVGYTQYTKLDAQDQGD